MRRQILGVATILLGLVGAGCSLPEVYPLSAGPTGGPSPYGAWYEQHWATNAVLLTAAHEQEHGRQVTEQEQQSEESSEAEPAALEATDMEGAPHACNGEPDCPHQDAPSDDSQAAESAQAEEASAATGGADAAADAKPTGALPGKSSDKVRY